MGKLMKQFGSTGREKKIKLPSYFKNVSKSLRNIAADEFDELLPFVKEYKESNEDFKIPNPKTVVKQLTKKIGTAVDFSKEIETGLKNLKKDLKSGKWHNKERLAKAENAAMSSFGGFGDSDFGGFDSEFGSDDFESFDTENDWEKTVSKSKPKANKADKSISNTINYIKMGSDKSLQSANILSNTIIGTNRLSAGHQQRLVAYMETGNQRRHSETLNSLNNINENVSSIVTGFGRIDELTTSTLDYHQKSLGFQEDTMNLVRELSDMNKIMLRREEEKSEDISDNDILSMGGAIKGNNYLKTLTKDKFANSFPMLGLFTVASDLLGMAKDMGMVPSAKNSKIVNSPISWAISQALGAAIGPAIGQSLTNLSKTVLGFGATLLTRMSNDFGDLIFGKESIFAPFVNGLGKFLGLNNKPTEHVNPSLERKATPFDTYTRKAIIHVIPTLLAKIYSAVSGAPELVVDYSKNGKLMTKESVVQDYQTRRKETARSGYYDMEAEMDEMITKLNPGELVTRNLRNGIEQLKEYMTLSGNFFVPNDEASIAEFEKASGVDHGSAVMIAALYRKMSEQTQLSIGKDYLETKSSYNSFIKDLNKDLEDSAIGQSLNDRNFGVSQWKKNKDFKSNQERDQWVAEVRSGKAEARGAAYHRYGWSEKQVEEGLKKDLRKDYDKDEFENSPYLSYEYGQMGPKVMHKGVVKPKASDLFEASKEEGMSKEDIDNALEKIRKLDMHQKEPEKKTTVGETIANAAAEKSEAVKEVVEKSRSLKDAILHPFKNLLGPVMGKIENKVDAFSKKMTRGMMHLIYGNIDKKTKKIKGEDGKEIEREMTVAEIFADFIKEKYEKYLKGPFMKYIYQPVKKHVLDPFKKKIIDPMKNFLFGDKGIFKKAKGWVGGMFSSVADKLFGKKDKEGKRVGNKYLNLIREKIKDKFSQGKEWFKNLTDSLADSLLGVKDKDGKRTGGKFGDLRNWIGDKFTKAKTFVSDFGKAMGERLFGTKDKDGKRHGGIFDFGVLKKRLMKGFVVISDLVTGKGSTKDKKNKFLDRCKRFFGTKAFKGMTTGAGLGMLASIFLPGGPILGSLIGGIVGLSTNFKELSKGLFGEDTKAGKLIAKLRKSAAEVNKLDIAAGGVLGGLAGYILSSGSPIFGTVAGAAVGSLATIAIQSKSLKKALFGDKDNDTGIISRHSLSLFKKFAPAGAFASGMGMAGFSVGGPILGMLSLTAASFFSQSDTFKRYLWGTSKNGKKHTLGLFDKINIFFKSYLFLPFKKGIRSLFTEFNYVVKRSIVIPLKGLGKMAMLRLQYTMDALATWFKNTKIGKFIMTGIEKITKTVADTFSWIGKKIFGIAKGLLSPIGRMFGGLIGGVTRLLGFGMKNKEGRNWKDEAKNILQGVKDQKKALKKSRGEELEREKAENLVTDETVRSLKDQLIQDHQTKLNIRDELIKLGPNVDPAKVKEVWGEIQEPQVEAARKTVDINSQQLDESKKQTELLKQIAGTRNDSGGMREGILSSGEEGEGRGRAYKGYIPDSLGMGSILGALTGFAGKLAGKAYSGVKGLAQKGIGKVKDFLFGGGITGYIAKRINKAKNKVKRLFGGGRDNMRGKSAQEMLQNDYQSMMYQSVEEINSQMPLLTAIPEISHYTKISTKFLKDISNNTDDLEESLIDINTTTEQATNGSMLSGLFNTLGGLFGGLGSTIMTGLTSLGTTLAPLLLPIAGIAASVAIVAGMGKMLYDAWGKVKDRQQMREDASTPEKVAAMSDEVLKQNAELAKQERNNFIRGGNNSGIDLSKRVGSPNYNLDQEMKKRGLSTVTKTKNKPRNGGNDVNKAYLHNLFHGEKSSGKGPLTQENPLVSGLSYAASGENSTVGDSGCSPVSMYNAFSNMGAGIDPYSVIGESSKYKVKDSGTDHYGMSKVADKFGFNMGSTTSNLTSNIDSTLNRGGQALVIGQGSEYNTPFTNAGHTIDVAGKSGNNYIISNPLHSGYEVWDKSVIDQSGMKAMSLDRKSGGRGYDDEQSNSKVDKAALVAKVKSLYSNGGSLDSSSYDGMHALMLARLIAYGELYQKKYHKKPLLTSGFRSQAKQASLRQKQGAGAAKPGRSKHEFGLAADISTTSMDASLAAQSGLSRPLLHWKVKPEPWHVEPNEWAGKNRDTSIAIARKYGDVVPPITGGAVGSEAGSGESSSSIFNVGAMLGAAGINSGNPLFTMLSGIFGNLFGGIADMFGIAKDNVTGAINNLTGNNTSGVVRGELAKGGRRAFIERLTPGAIKGYQDGRILPSLTIAQGILESGWGRNAIGNNIFGIKAGKNWKGAKQNVMTHEQGANGLYKTRADFRDYPSVDEAILDHTKILGASRYRKVGLQNSTKFTEATQRVKQGGYATDNEYPPKLNKIISGNKIDMIDDAVLKGNFDTTYAKATGLEVPKPGTASKPGQAKPVSPAAAQAKAVNVVPGVRVRDKQNRSKGRGSNVNLAIANKQIPADIRKQIGEISASAGQGAGDNPQVVALLAQIAALMQQLVNKPDIKIPDTVKAELPPNAFGNILQTNITPQVTKKVSSVSEKLGSFGFDRSNIEALKQIASGR